MLDGITWCCVKDEYHESEEFYYEKDGHEVNGPGEDPEFTDGTLDVSGFGPAQIRKIREEIIDKYEIKVEFSTQKKGEQTYHYYPITKDRGRDIISYKRREIATKDFKAIPSTGSTKVDLFGMRSNQFSPSTVVITAGELDAPAAYQMLHTHVSKLMCVSLPFGDKNLKSLLDNKDFLDEADDVVFAGDQDDPGKAVIEKISMIVPGIRIMQFSEKDPCDMLTEGKEAEFRDSFGRARKHKPSSIIEVEDIEDDALIPVEWGLDYPFDGLTKMTYGLMPSSIIGIGGGPGSGKSTIMKQLVTHLAFHHKRRTAVFAFEEKPSQTLRSFGGFLIGKRVWLPDCVYDEDQLQDSISSLRSRVVFYNHKGFREWEDIEAAITYMIMDGVTDFFLDPVSALTVHLDSGDANTFLNKAMYFLSLTVQQYPVNFFHFNHLNNPKTGPDHGAGGKVYGSQFTGSRAMWKFSTDLWGARRNQYATDEDERNTIYLAGLKNRLAGEYSEVRLKYNKALGKLEEVGHGKGAAAFTDLTNTKGGF
jgi:twinkle protein